MRRSGAKIIALAAGLTMLGATSVFAANETPASAAPARLEITDDGPVLITPAGMTLYTYGPDETKPGTSQCSHIPQISYFDRQGEFGNFVVVRPDAAKSCVQKWPPYLADANAQPDGDFGLITRPEGGKQWTFNGRPLYRSVKDQRPGDRYGAMLQNGGNRRGFGFAAPAFDLPAGLKLMRLDESLVLATANGRPVYAPKGARASACQGCEELFTPVTAPAIAKVSGEWSIVEAGAGRRQYAFKGKPLYAAPVSLEEQDIADAGTWEPVAFRPSPGRPADIGTRFTLVGTVYTDKAGLSLYSFSCRTASNDGATCDDPGDPAGYWSALCGTGEECAKRWRPYVASVDAKPVGDWSIVDVAYPLFTDAKGFTYPPEVPRVKAWAYRGRPVYTYYEDREPGEIWGDRIKWVGFSTIGVVHVPGRVAAE